MGKIRMNWDKILQQASGAVYINDVLVGTAWLCNKQYMITAGHLFQNEQCCSIQFNEERNVDQSSRKYTAEVIFSKNIDKSGVDFAILKLEEEVNRFWLPLQVKRIEYTNTRIISYGYGKECSGSAEGMILGSHLCDQNTNLELIKINSQQLVSYGYSGAAIFDIKMGKVIGIQIEATTEQSRENKTVLAYPIYRLYNECEGIQEFLLSVSQQKGSEKEISSFTKRSKAMEVNSVWSDDFIENHFLPLLAISILNLHHHDNLDAYVRCIIVKLMKKNRRTIFEAKNKINIPSGVRVKHKNRERDYGVVGIMLQQNVTVFCDFKNKECYKLSLSGESQKINIDFEKEAGDREERIALLVSPIKDAQNKIIGVLSFDFFAQNNSKDIVQKISEEKSELDRLIFHSTYYAEVISKAVSDGLFKLERRT